MAKRAKPKNEIIVKPWMDRWVGRLALVGAGVVLMAVCFAPIGLFFLAWAALVPWLIIVTRTSSNWRAFGWSWLLGIGVYAANMWWLAGVTLPGMFGLIVYLGLWFAIPALVLRAILPADTNTPGRALILLVLVPVTWTACEWIRGHLFTGLPWLYVGHSQTPVILLCQIADVTGVYGVTFWVVMLNALALLFIRHWNFRLTAMPASVATAVVMAIVALYGAITIGTRTSAPGPVVLVIQPNYPQSNRGEKGASQEQLVVFHVEMTREALSDLRGRGERVDLVLWSETMMPELNREFRDPLRGDPKAGAYIDFVDDVEKIIAGIAREFETTLIVGATAQVPPSSRHNSAYLFDHTGVLAADRYDKIHLVPFGEYMPFKKSAPFLYRIFNSFNPYTYDYTLEAGDKPHIFKDRAGHRYAPAICFEDVDARLMTRMFDSPSGKQADVIVNLTNDGWFRGQQMAQHLQLARFRSIENRAPTARSVNTGISAFIDPSGRIIDQILTGRIGWSARRLAMDRRHTVYTRVGDVFAILCITAVAALLLLRLSLRIKARFGR